jgi:hypothetical protein
MEAEKRVHAVIIIEVLGKPAEHIDKAIHDLVERLGQEKNIEILNKKFYEPKPTENLFITFCEVELAVPSLVRLMEICFMYMPSSIEITEPRDLSFNLNDANSILNGLISRLHQYDAIAKKITFENMILKNQLQQLGAGTQMQQEVQPKKAEQKAKTKSNLKHKAKSKGKTKSDTKTKSKKKK